MPAIRIVVDIEAPDVPDAKNLANLLPEVIRYATHGEVLAPQDVSIGEVTVTSVDEDHEVCVPGSSWAADRGH